MKTLYFLALVGFALAVGWAIPFNEDETEALDNVPTRLKKIANDLQAEDTASYAGLGEEDDLVEDEDEDEQNEDDNGENTDENPVQEHEEDEDEDSDEADEVDENRITLPKEASDPIVGLFVRARRVVRGVRRVVRRFRRRRRRGGRRRRRGRGRRGRG